MSVEFTLTGNRLSVEQWNEIIRAWIEKREFEAYTDPYFSDDEEPVAIIWGWGSIRGAVLRHDAEGTVTLRLNALASRTDWRCGFQIVKKAMKKGGGKLRRETGERYDRDDVRSGQADREAVADFCASVTMLGQSLGEEGEGHLPLQGFDLPLTADDLPPCDEDTMPDVEGRLLRRIKRYGGAFMASTMVFEDGLRVSTWALIPTVIAADVDVVDCDVGDSISIAMPDLLEILGEAAEPLGEALYLPALDPEADAELIARLGEAAIEDIDAYMAERTAQAAEELARIRENIALVVRKFGSGMADDPEGIVAELVDRGVEAGEAGALVTVVFEIVSLGMEGRDLPEVAEEMLAQGYPEGLIVTVLEVIGDEMGDPKPKKKRGFFRRRR